MAAVTATRVRRAAARTGQYAALLCYLVFLAFPLVWLLSTALKTPQEMALLDPTWIPLEPTLANFAAAFGEQDLVGAARRSLTVAVCSAVLTVLLALPAAYVLARYRSVVNRIAMSWVLVSQVFPFILVIIALFMILRQFGLVNSLVGLVLVHATWCLPFVLWMLRGYLRGIPRVLEEAAAVDGAGRWRTLVSVVAPLAAPGVAAALMFGFISSWNEFLFALILLKDPGVQTLPLVLVAFTGPEGVARLGPLAAASLMAAVPSLVFFAFIQRRFRGGLVDGAVKG
ncbi:carbohydrate ABC transporter permease [Streptomonospora nanhaiensis]|uniref:Multiple sugar transport system permease protein n=1 Tax=Streptomonospora nanhaiensis TaxID=1323731 RepID=A0A853BMJ7_9ACTN|nr:carbohydrate ABC transporter permease [Streptomonospora nanhaiensis]MBV2361948.1 carbohydrate ABC transporter permease [Streptomonospora nanhaiensis]MBX9391632.1 carbohydrate ABC transporter permease [Streptomonospora nanhaiensis]NYI96230.1 multiple sugar transport system permease protein [Streptomonospora nanhaiensis]